MCDTCPLYQRQKVVDLLMKQSLKSQANCPTSLCCCSSGIHTSCLQPAIFQMWLLKESSMGYFTLIYTPGRNPTWLKEAEASFEVTVKEINTYQINLNAMIYNSSS
ncbi:sorting nexin-24 isoform X4 [Macaca fascicularis]|uniref:sorting nexin-24 isoform X4 n=1 Tax=Macaca fascicularis TaxID=9541 RepID=UPI003D15CE22